MLKPWLIRAVQVVGTLALVVLVVIVYRRTDWCKGFTPDGIMTLIAGVLAFGAVQWQMWDQRRTSRREQENHKRAVATALLAEIDDFYKFILKDLWEKRDSICGSIASLTKLPPELGPLPSTASVVYRATAHQLGALSVSTVKSVVGLYNFIASFVDTYEAYRKAWSPSSPPADPELATKLRDIFDAVPTLILDSYRACERLGKEQATPFEKSGLSIAHIGEADEEGQTMKQALEAEAARIRQRIGKGNDTPQGDVRSDEISHNEQ
jgi:hypothetical protein